MKVEYSVEPKTNNQKEYSEVRIYPENNKEMADLRWMEEVFNFKTVTAIPRYLGGNFHIAFIPERKEIK